MFETTRRAVVLQVGKLKMQFSQREGLPFGEILSPGSVLRILEEQKAVFRDRIFSPIVTLAAFIAQVSVKIIPAVGQSPKSLRSE